MRVFYSFHEIFSFNSYLNIVSALMEKKIWQKILFKKRKWWSISQYNHANREYPRENRYLGIFNGAKFERDISNHGMQEI